MKEGISFQGKSKEVIESFVQRENYLSILKALKQKTETGKVKLKEHIAHIFRTKGKNDQIDKKKRLIAMEKSQEITAKLVILIERYASMTLSLELKLRLQRDNIEVFELDRKRNEIHNEIKELVKNSVISDEKITELIEMRVQDRLAESEIENISKKVTEAAGVSLQINDDDLIFVDQDNGWRPPKPEEKKNTYSLVYDCVYQPYDGSYYKFSPDSKCCATAVDNMVPDDHINDIIEMLKNTAKELKLEGASYFETNSYYRHDYENHPGDDFMALSNRNFIIRFPKEHIDKVIEKLKANSSGIKQNSTTID